MTPTPTWPVRPGQPAPASTPAERLVKVAASTWACPECGAIVARELADRHESWHGTHRPGLQPARVVHGMATPKDVRIPYRVVTIASGLPPDRALAALRSWAEDQKHADMGLHEPGGFRARFAARPSWRSYASPDAVAVRLAVDLEADGAGSRVTALLVADLVVDAVAYVPPPALTALRFDALVAEMADLLGRR